MPKVENASLEKIKTVEKFEFLKMELNLLVDHEGGKYWWTGATDLGQEGKLYQRNLVILYGTQDFPAPQQTISVCFLITVLGMKQMMQLVLPLITEYVRKINRTMYFLT